MNELVIKKIDGIKSSLVNLGYTCRAEEDDSNLELKASKDEYTFTILYSEEECRRDYSEYDMDCIVSIDNSSYIYILSERLPDNLESDFNELATILQSINSNDFHLENERKLLFWTRTHLVVKYKDNQVYLLKTL